MLPAEKRSVILRRKFPGTEKGAVSRSLLFLYFQNAMFRPMFT